MLFKSYCFAHNSVGIDPEVNAAHQQYLQGMCEDFVLNMVNMVRKAAGKRKRAPDALVEECLQHIQTAQVKCASFRGREETLEVYIFLWSSVIMDCTYVVYILNRVPLMR